MRNDLLAIYSLSIPAFSHLARGWLATMMICTLFPPSDHAMWRLVYWTTQKRKVCLQLLISPHTIQYMLNILHCKSASSQHVIIHVVLPLFVARSRYVKQNPCTARSFEA